jgi:hypothetical protein
MELDRLSPVLYCTVFYTTLCFLFHKFLKPPEALVGKEKEAAYWDYFGQHVSIVHSLISSFLALAYYFGTGGVRYDEDYNQTTINIFGHSIGYFLYDLLYGEVSQVHDNAMRGHHVGVLVGGLILYSDSVGGSAVSICLLVTETVNPCILSRHILKAQGKEGTRAFQIVETLMVVCFTITRIPLASLVILNMWISPIGLPVKLCASGIYGIGMQWVFIITYKLTKIMREKQMALWFCNYIGWLKNHMILNMVLMYGWAVFAPAIAVYIYNVPHINLVINGFVVI